MNPIIPLIFLVALSFASALPNEHRLIKLSETDSGNWLNSQEIGRLISERINFIDITDHQEILDKHPQPKLFAIPESLRYRAIVHSSIARLNASRIDEFLTPFTAYFNRYYTTESGVESSNWLFRQIQNAINTSGYRGTATVQQFHHTWEQSSVIAKIQAANSSATQIVILGAHLDCVTSGPEGRSPGADDNGSGSATILEAFRALLDDGFVPKINVEFHWYAAEEVGLRGALAIAEEYTRDGKEIVGMANFDMTGYVAPDLRMAIIDDYTDPELNDFIKILVEGYSSIGWGYKTCGYGCSDHAAWFNLGYRSTFPHELNSSPYVHTINDTTSNLSFERIKEFSKFAVAFAIELAEPSSL